MLKICHVVGNRPQFIKLAPVMRALAAERGVENVIVHSGQHYHFGMSQVFFDQLDLPAPRHNLAVGSGTHGVQTGRVLARIDSVFMKERPALCLVYGDTNTTLAGALAAHKLHIPVGHVESGLRENVWRPEEINRKIADDCAEMLFCPTRTAAENLRAEGVAEGRIFLTGDVTYDAFLWTVKHRVKKADESTRAPNVSPYFLVTLHRAETVDHGDILAEVVAALLEAEAPIVFPVHPRTMKYLRKYGHLKRLKACGHITLLPAVGYIEFLRLLLGAQLVITDSGGVIKEAFYARKPCVTVDNTTEYLEIRDSGANVWAGKRKCTILAAVARMRAHDPGEIRPERIFGNGRAAEKIAAIALRRCRRNGARECRSEEGR